MIRLYLHYCPIGDGLFTNRRLIGVNNKGDIVLNNRSLREAQMLKERIFTFREIAIWTAILGSVVGYQLWQRADPAPLTMALPGIEQRS